MWKMPPRPQLRDEKGAPLLREREAQAMCATWKMLPIGNIEWFTGWFCRFPRPIKYDVDSSVIALVWDPVGLSVMPLRADESSDDLSRTRRRGLSL
jgi:hypothetical protein